MPDSPINPYDSPAGRGEIGESPSKKVSPWRMCLLGVLCSVLSAIPLTALTALLFRFPVPFAGYLSGVDAVIPAMLALLFYGVLFGGFVVVGLLGGLGGLVAGFALRNRYRLCWVATCSWAALVTAAGVLTLAILDKIIGPW